MAVAVRTRAGDRPARRLRPDLLVPAGCLAVIAGADAVITSQRLSVPLLAGVDWSGHLATTALVLLVVLGERVWAGSRRLAATVMAASILIDLDHIPLYLGYPGVAFGGRPATHSLSTVAVLLLAATASRRPQLRAGLAAAAAGVAAHFVRDIATGPGLPLLWPLRSDNLRLPYWPYALLAVVLAAAATWRLARGPARHPTG